MARIADDALGRMASFAIDGVVQAEYAYNAQGQQVVRRLTQSQQTIHNVFDLDDEEDQQGLQWRACPTNASPSTFMTRSGAHRR